jgi:hypothetical protein
MCAFFQYDSWLRSLSLNNLNLSSGALKALVDCMDRSNSIIQIGLEYPDLTLEETRTSHYVSSRGSAKT